MRTYRDKYLDKLGRVDGVVSYTDEFLSALGVYNPNQTYQDTILYDLGLIGPSYFYNQLSNLVIPEKTLNDHLQIRNPGILPCSLTVFWGGLHSRESIDIPVVFPQSITESINSNFVKESPVGSTFPIIAFSNTDPQDVSLSFTAVSDFLPSGYTSLRQYVNAVKSMCKPRYSGNIVLAPSVVVRYSDITFYGICNSVSVEYEDVYAGKYTDFEKNTADNISLVVARFNCSFTLTGGD